MEILVSEISTRSGLAVLVLMSAGMAAGGKSLALRPGRLTKSLLEGGDLFTDAVEDRVMTLGKVALVKCLLASIQDVCSGGIRGVT